MSAVKSAALHHVQVWKTKSGSVLYSGVHVVIVNITVIGLSFTVDRMSHFTWQFTVIGA